MRKPPRVATANSVREPSIERTNEYDAFMADLRAYHERRGTSLDPEPKIGNRHVDLFRLYHHVLAEGGYDAISEVKLAWRKVAADFVPAATQTQQINYSFQLKTVYYKNLAAYEISTFHKREPPPKEILEDVSAKGGDLLNRTLENFRRPIQDVVPDEPAEPDRNEEGETLVSSRRNRPVRQVQTRVLFDPAPTPPRQRAGSASRGPTPAHAGHAAHTPHNSHIQLQHNQAVANMNPHAAGLGPETAVLASYEPEMPVGIPMQAIPTPAVDPDRFRLFYANRKTEQMQLGLLCAPGLMVPGTGFPGPNIYKRIDLALRSGIQEEVEFALHHMVKISHERGDKYKFASFPGLVETILGCLLKLTLLVYDRDTVVSYSEDQREALHTRSNAPGGKDDNDPIVLDGLHGTPNIIDKLEELGPAVENDGLQTEDFSKKVLVATEAALVLRNMSLLPDNAEYLAECPIGWDALLLVLSLPARSYLTEAQLYCNETIEQLVAFGDPTSERAAPIYKTLWMTVSESDDRAAIVSSLRALGRFGSKLKSEMHLPDVPDPVITRLVDWLLIQDSVLIEASLGILYILTSTPDGLLQMARCVGIDCVIKTVMPLVMHGGIPESHTRLPAEAEEARSRSKSPPRLPQTLITKLREMPDLKEQCSHWLRCLFEEENESEVTQLRLWSAYSSTFNPTGRIMAAKDFISYISITFNKASAHLSTDDPQPRYTIKGIKPRDRPVGLSGQHFFTCRWRPAPDGAICEHIVNDPSEFAPHLVETHLEPAQLAAKENGHGFFCRWADCRRWFKTEPEIGRHIRIHIQASRTDRESRFDRIDRWSELAGKESSRSYWNTPVYGDSLGPVPVAAVMVLRNVARQLPRLESRPEVVAQFAIPDEIERAEEDGPLVEPELEGFPAAAGVGEDRLPSETAIDGKLRPKSRLVARAFGQYRDYVYYAMAYNLTLREHLGSLAFLIADASGGVW